MVSAILCIIIGFVIGIRKEISECTDILDDFPDFDNNFRKKVIASSIIRGIVSSLVGLALWIIIGGFIGMFLPQDNIQQRYELVKAENTEENEYFTTTDNNGKTYYEYAILINNQPEKRKTDSSKVCLIEGDYEPEVVFSINCFASDKYKWFVHDMFVYTEYTEIYVPKTQNS